MLLKHLLAPFVFSGIVCSSAHLAAVCKWMCMAHTSQHCGVGGFWLFLAIKIDNERSYFMNWDWSKSTFVLNFFSPAFVLYCIVQQQHCLEYSKNVAYRPGTWSTTTNLHKGLSPKENSIRRRVSRKITGMLQKSTYSLTSKGSWPMLCIVE